MQRPSDAWLEAANAEFRRRNVPPHPRPWAALRAWADEMGGSQVLLPSDAADYINSWFAQRTGGRSKMSGSFFYAAHYFDASFWPLELPLVYGARHVRIFDALRGMPAGLMHEIANDPDELGRYKRAWLDWMDVAYGFDDLERSAQERGSLFQGLLQAARNELGAATVDLLTVPAGQHAAHLSRNATEKVLKMVLVERSRCTENELKKLGHGLDRVVEKLEGQGESLEPELASLLQQLPGYQEGYSPTVRSAEALAEIYDRGRRAAAWASRCLSGRAVEQEPR